MSNNNNNNNNNTEVPNAGGDNSTDFRNKGKQRPIVGTFSPEQDRIHRERALAAGRRRTNQPVINLRDTGDDNYMQVIKANHERRKALEAESKRGLPKELIYNPKQVIDSREFFKDEERHSSPSSRPTRRPKDQKPLTEA